MTGLFNDCDRIRSATVEKEVVSSRGSSWVPQYAVLSSNRYFISAQMLSARSRCSMHADIRFSNPVDGSLFLAKGDHPAPQDVLDQIPLHEVISVDVQHQLIVAGAQAAQSLADEPEHQEGEAQSSSLLVISTIPSGYNSGRKYCFRLARQEDADEWQKELNALMRMAQQYAGKQNARSHRGSKAQPLCFHARALSIYESTAFQGCVAVLIAVGCGLDLTEVLLCT